MNTKTSIKDIKKEYKGRKKSLKADHRATRRAHKSELKELRSERDSALLLAYEAIGKTPPKDPPKRSVLEEIGNAITHGVGSVFSIIALILMLVSSETADEYVAAFIYSFGLLVMFTMSCLYHSFRYGSAVKRLFRRFDYSCIYLLIGATFAPPLLNVVRGTFGIIFFIVQWAVIVFGITFVGVFGPTRFRKIHIPLYVILGWSALMLLPTLIGSSLPLALFILAGGVIYSIGIIPFVMKSKASHFIWHFFVLAGAVVQWIGIYLYIYLA